MPIPFVQAASATLVVVAVADVGFACLRANVVGGPSSPQAIWSAGMRSPAALEASAKRPVPTMLMKCMLENCQTTNRMVGMSEEERLKRSEVRSNDQTKMRR
jgi:hypothetical protein